VTLNLLWTTLVQALRQLSRNKARSALTSLGILIGVAAVIAMVNISTGATLAVEQSLSSIGQSVLFVMPGGEHGAGVGTARPFTEDDADAVKQQVVGVVGVAAVSQSRKLVAAGDQTWTTQITGSNADYLPAQRWVLERGRDIELGEHLAGADVCLLGRTVVEELFGAQDPLGQEVRIESLTCQVIGTLLPKGENLFGQDQDDFILVPLRSFQRRVQGTRDVGFLYVAYEEGASSAAIKARVQALLRQRRHIREGSEPDFVVRDMAEVLGMLDTVSGVLTSLLAAIAAVSLLVGGIGIMNIMLVSVTERTREIGIRLAVGALARDVLLQFLIESMVLSAAGGAMGVVVGALGGWGVAKLMDFPLSFDPWVAVGAVIFSGFIGVVFGYFPARRAARMKPIDALRHA
jgi:putative ABC transport system permease protein